MLLTCLTGRLGMSDITVWQIFIMLIWPHTGKFEFCLEQVAIKYFQNDLSNNSENYFIIDDIVKLPNIITNRVYFTKSEKSGGYLSRRRGHAQFWWIDYEAFVTHQLVREVSCRAGLKAYKERVHATRLTWPHAVPFRFVNVVPSVLTLHIKYSILLAYVWVSVLNVDWSTAVEHNWYPTNSKNIYNKSLLV